MKNIQIIDGADNDTYSIFQATDDEFCMVFPQQGQDLEVVEDFIDRVGEKIARLTLEPLWDRPIHKKDVKGIHGNLSTTIDRKQNTFQHHEGSGSSTNQRGRIPPLCPNSYKLGKVPADEIYLSFSL